MAFLVGFMIAIGAHAIVYLIAGQWSILNWVAVFAGMIGCYLIGYMRGAGQRWGR